MKSGTVHIESLRIEAIKMLMALKTRQEIEGAIQALGEMRMQETVFYEEDGTPYTKQMMLEDHDQDWNDHANGKTFGQDEIEQWIKNDLGVSASH
jgi:hypothetical protein